MGMKTPSFGGCGPLRLGCVPSILAAVCVGLFSLHPIPDSGKDVPLHTLPGCGGCGSDPLSLVLVRLNYKPVKFGLVSSVAVKMGFRCCHWLPSFHAVEILLY